MQAAAIQACPQILDNDLNLRVKDNVVAMLILCGVSTDQRLVAKYVYFFSYDIDYCSLATQVIPQHYLCDSLFFSLLNGKE